MVQMIRRSKYKNSKKEVIKLKQSDKTKKSNLKKLNAKEVLELVNQQWATVYDIMKIGNCGKNTAQKVKKEIKDEIETRSSKELPYGVVPMEKVVDYYNININYLRRISKWKNWKLNGKTYHY